MTEIVSSYHAEQAAHRRRFDDALPANKDTIFAALDAAGIKRVVVTFNGSGDDGQIESVTGFAADDTERSLPAVKIEVAIPEFQLDQTAIRRPLLAEALEVLSWTILEHTHGGWEDNDGGYGEIRFDAHPRTITLEMNERYIETHFHEHEF